MLVLVLESKVQKFVRKPFVKRLPKYLIRKFLIANFKIFFAEPHQFNAAPTVPDPTTTE
jgi:hypothetical protein